MAQSRLPFGFQSIKTIYCNCSEAKTAACVNEFSPIGACGEEMKKLIGKFGLDAILRILDVVSTCNDITSNFAKTVNTLR